jgi:kynurenine 3-monooxygenase
MVMFHHEIPYAVARERGEIQAGILASLTEHVDSIASISPDRMDAVVREHLEPLAQEFRVAR